MAFAGTKKQHRKSASFEARSARIWAQKARAAARRGDCRDALHLFGVAAFTAGRAKAERLWAAKKGKGGYFGSRVHALQKTIFRACRVR